MADEDVLIETGNKSKINDLFKGKKVQKMSIYIKELVLIENQVQREKRFIKRVFGDKPQYYHFVRDNTLWILEKYNYDFSKDEVKGFLAYLNKQAKNLVHDKYDLAIKFDNVLQ